MVRMEGEIDIGCAAELKKLLIEALGCGVPVRVVLEDATDLDATAVQLLWAAGREAKGLGAEFGLAGRTPERIAATLAEAGFEPFPVLPGAK